MSIISKLLFIILVLSLKISFGQEKLQYRISLTPTQLIFRELLLGIDVQKGANSLGVMFTYKPDYQKEGEVRALGYGMLGGYTEQNQHNYLYQSIFSSFSYKRYFSSSKSLYLESQFFYRKWWFDKKEASFNNVESYNFKGLRDETQNVYGMKILFGQIKYLGKSAKIRPFIDAYAGLGIRQKSISYFTYFGEVKGAEVNNYAEASSPFYITPHLNVKIEIAWF